MGRRSACSIEYLREDEPLGTGGALGLLPERPDRTPLCAQRGPRDVGRHRRPARVPCAAAGSPRPSARGSTSTRCPFGCVERDGDRVVAMEEKPAIAREVNTGIYALEPWVVGLVEPGGAADDARPHRAGHRPRRAVGAFEVEGDWVDVGQRDQLARGARAGGS